MAWRIKNYKSDGGNEWVIGGKLTIRKGAKVSGINLVPGTGTAGHFLKKTSGGYEFSTLPDAGPTTKGVAKQAALVAEAAGSAPTAAEFKALLDALKAAGLMATT